MKKRGLVLEFKNKVKLAENIYSFYFKKDKDFYFMPGQYIRLTLSHDNPDERGTNRYFTISSSPSEEEIMITTKLVKSTFKKKIISLESGEPVKAFGPMGNLVLDKKEKVSLVFLSGGMGVTPFRSMIRYSAKKNLQIPITLIASFKNQDEMIFFDELTTISKRNKFIKVVYTISSLKSQVFKDDSRIEKGKIGKKFIKKYVEDINRPKYFIVGPPVMVEDTKNMLQSLRIPDEKILTENFTGY